MDNIYIYIISAKKLLLLLLVFFGIINAHKGANTYRKRNKFPQKGVAKALRSCYRYSKIIILSRNSHKFKTYKQPFLNASIFQGEKHHEHFTKYERSNTDHVKRYMVYILEKIYECVRAFVR